MTHRWLSSILTAAVLVLISLPATAADTGTVAVVVDASGTVTAGAGAESRPVKRFDRLPLGTTLATGDESSLVLAFMTGPRIQLGPDTEVELEATAAKLIDGTAEELPPVATGPAIEAIPATQRPGRRSGAIRIRSGSVWGSQVEDLYPRDGASILAESAVLSFAPIPAVDSYRVDIEDEMGETVFALETRSPEVSVPEGVLRPGVEYYWRVRSSGRRALGGQGEALFTTLDTTVAADLERLEAQLGEEGSPSSTLLLAEVNRSLGRYREACAHLGRARTAEGAAGSLDEEWESFRCDAYLAGD